MGGQMTKELGVYNEEEKVFTPQGPQRYRLLNDPRSATAGIKRTPIQVECTPTKSKIGSVLKVNHCLKEEVNSNGENIINSIAQTDVVISNDCKQDNNIEVNAVETKQTCYLETNIDELDSPISSVSQHLKEPNHKQIIQLSDIRSPSLGLSRTPVLIECTPELFALHAQIDNMSFYDFEVHTDDPSTMMSGDDPSAIVSDDNDDDTLSLNNQTPLKQWLIDVDNKACNESINNPISPIISDSPKTVAKKHKELNTLKKQLFFTPDAKDFSKPKVRTPLGTLQTSQVGESPNTLLKAKQWRNIKEERQRRGIMDSENTPPNLPPLLKVSSAPSKVLDHKRIKALWDNENTMFI